MVGRSLLHYQIVDKLGAGGMGVVYKARDTHLDRFAAIKTLPADRMADPERKRRFVQEAKAASALNHPNIVTIYDITADQGVDFIAMEYIAGKSIEEMIPRQGMRLADALNYAVQIADGLSKAHQEGILHRDLKPGNIMVGEGARVKILDFGIAKLTGPAEISEDESTRTIREQTDDGAIVGTASYMSPEQAEGRPLDARTDIFSFGIVLYEMLSGRKPIQGPSRIATVSAILKESPKPLSSIAPEIPYELERLVERCLRKDPDRRWQSMRDLRVALLDLKEESDSGALGPVRPQQKSRMPVEGGEATDFVRQVANTGGGPLASTSFCVTAKGVYYLTRIPGQRGTEIRFVPHLGGEPKTLGSIPRNPSSGLSLSPDGPYLLCSQYDQSAAELMLVENFH